MDDGFCNSINTPHGASSTRQQLSFRSFGSSYGLQTPPSGYPERPGSAFQPPSTASAPAPGRLVDVERNRARAASPLRRPPRKRCGKIGPVSQTKIRIWLRVRPHKPGRRRLQTVRRAEVSPAAAARLNGDVFILGQARPLRDAGPLLPELEVEALPVHRLDKPASHLSIDHEHRPADLIALLLVLEQPTAPFPCIPCIPWFLSAPPPQKPLLALREDVPTIHNASCSAEPSALGRPVPDALSSTSWSDRDPRCPRT